MAGKRELVFVVGDKGRDRVRVRKQRRASGEAAFIAEFMEYDAAGHGRRRQATLRARTKEAAKQEANALHRRLRSRPRPMPSVGAPDDPPAAALVGWLVAAYLREREGAASRAVHRFEATTLEMFVRLAGADTPVAQVSEGHVARYARARSTSHPHPDLACFPELRDCEVFARGDLLIARRWEPDGSVVEREHPPPLMPRSLAVLPEERRRGWRWPAPVGGRAVAREVNVIRALFRWAAAQRRADGTPWIAAHRIAAMRPMDDPESRQPQMTEQLYRELLGVAPQIADDLADLLVVAHETGRRIGAIVGLTFRDFDHREQTVRWRRELDKEGRAARVPASTALLRCVLDRARLLGLPEDAPLPVFGRRVRDTAAPQRKRGESDSAYEARASAARRRVLGARGRPMLPGYARDLLDRAFQRLGRRRPVGFGFHALRRKFATEAAELGGTKVAMALGGWRDARTFMDRYNQPGDDQLRGMLASRLARRAAPADRAA